MPYVPKATKVPSLPKGMGQWYCLNGMNLVTGANCAGGSTVALDASGWPVTGTAPAGTPAAGGDGSTCDWTQASWLDVTTWCSANWAIAALGGLGLYLVIKGKF